MSLMDELESGAIELTQDNIDDWFAQVIQMFIQQIAGPEFDMGGDRAYMPDEVLELMELWDAFQAGEDVDLEQIQQDYPEFYDYINELDPQDSGSGDSTLEDDFAASVSEAVGQEVTQEDIDVIGDLLGTFKKAIPTDVESARQLIVDLIMSTPIGTAIKDCQTWTGQVEDPETKEIYDGWQDCVNIGAILSIPGLDLPFPPSMIDVSVRDIIKTVQEVGDAWDDFIADPSGWLENKIDEAAQAIEDWWNGVSDYDGNILNDVYDIVKGAVGSVLAGTVTGTIKEQFPDIFTGFCGNQSYYDQDQAFCNEAGVTPSDPITDITPDVVPGDPCGFVDGVATGTIGSDGETCVPNGQEDTTEEPPGGEEDDITDISPSVRPGDPCGFVNGQATGTIGSDGETCYSEGGEVIEEVQDEEEIDIGTDTTVENVGDACTTSSGEPGTLQPDPQGGLTLGGESSDGLICVATGESTDGGDDSTEQDGCPAGTQLVGYINGNPLCLPDDWEPPTGPQDPVDEGCPAGQEEVNGQCVDKCPEGYERVGGVCIQPLSDTTVDCEAYGLNSPEGGASTLDECVSGGCIDPTLVWNGQRCALPPCPEGQGRFNGSLECVAACDTNDTIPADHPDCNAEVEQVDESCPGTQKRYDGVCQEPCQYDESFAAGTQECADAEDQVYGGEEVDDSGPDVVEETYTCPDGITQSNRADRSDCPTCADGSFKTFDAVTGLSLCPEDLEETVVEEDFGVCPQGTPRAGQARTSDDDDCGVTGDVIESEELCEDGSVPDPETGCPDIVIEPDRCPDGSIPDPVTGCGEEEYVEECPDGSTPDPITGCGGGEVDDTCPNGAVDFPLCSECEDGSLPDAELGCGGTVEPEPDCSDPSYAAANPEECATEEEEEEEGGGQAGGGVSGMFRPYYPELTGDPQLLARTEFPITDYLAGLFKDMA